MTVDNVWNARVPHLGECRPELGFFANSLRFCEGMLWREFLGGLPRAAFVAIGDRLREALGHLRRARVR